MIDVYAEIDKAKNKKYRLGSHDCLRLACKIFEIQTGIDHWQKFKGYKTKRQSLVKILKIAPSLKDAVTVILKQEPTSHLFSQRGDVCLFNSGKEDCLGICLGEKIAFLGKDGLIYLPITHESIRCAWRVKKCLP